MRRDGAIEQWCAPDPDALGTLPAAAMWPVAAFLPILVASDSQEAEAAKTQEEASSRSSDPKAAD